jgi:hypothetical protein
MIKRKRTMNQETLHRKQKTTCSWSTTTSWKMNCKVRFLNHDRLSQGQGIMLVEATCT